MIDDPLEQTQEIPALAAISGVWLITRFYGFNCGGQMRRGPVNPPALWFPCDLNRKVAWTLPRGAGKTSMMTRYRK